MEIKTKSFVQEKAQRMLGDKFKVPTTKTICKSSKEEKVNS